MYINEGKGTSSSFLARKTIFYLPHTPPTPPQLIYFPFLILLLFLIRIHDHSYRTSSPHRPYMDPTLTLPPPPPHFYCFPSTTTFLLLSFHHHHHHQHHISIVFPPPPPPPHFYCFPSSPYFHCFFHHYRHISIVLPPLCKVIWWWKENNRNVQVAVVVVEGKQ